MLSPKTKYLIPKTIDEACYLALKYKEGAKIIAGGTDIVPKMKCREVLPKYIIDIKGIAGLDYINYDETEGLRVGALATIHSIKTSPIVQEKFHIISQAASQLGSAQIRKRATIGGNLCNAAPSAETATPLMVLGARAKILGADGARIVPIESFFIGPGKTVLKPDEILIEIQVPNSLPHSGEVYLKHTVRKAMDLAIIGVAVMVTIDENVVSDVRIGLGSALFLGRLFLQRLKS